MGERIHQVYAKQTLTHLEKHVRKNKSIIKLQARTTVNLKHLECHERRNALSLGRFFKYTLKQDEYAKFSLTHLHLQNKSYIESETERVFKIEFNTPRIA